MRVLCRPEEYRRAHGGAYGAKGLPMHAHTAFAERKSFVSRVAMQFADIFSQVSSHRFRTIDDYTITNGLIPLMALHTGQGEK